MVLAYLPPRYPPCKHLGMPEKPTKGLCGIYAIRNKATGECYVGQSISIHSRIKDHLYKLSRNMHATPALQTAFNEHGLAGFVFDIVEICPRPQLTEREDHWITALGAKLQGYNRRDGIAKQRRTLVSVHVETKDRLEAMGMDSINATITHLLSITGN
jgi:group I intron endonuclease